MGLLARSRAVEVGTSRCGCAGLVVGQRRLSLRAFFGLMLAVGRRRRGVVVRPVGIVAGIGVRGHGMLLRSDRYQSRRLVAEASSRGGRLVLVPVARLDCRP